MAKFMDVTATIYNKNMSRGTSVKRIGRPILQENFTEVLSINSHENWEFKIDLQDMIMSGSPNFFSQTDYFTTKYEIKVNKYKMYREAFFRCMATSGCGSNLPDQGTMINAAILASPHLGDLI
tara:strand:- start:425 stop:793 length:369 start_codon:yes stop_codon:yes gene_type:complete